MRKQYLLALLIPAFITVNGCAASPSSQNTNPAIAQETPANSTAENADTDVFAEVLSTYVDAEGLVDYTTLQKNRQQLELICHH